MKLATVTRIKIDDDDNIGDAAPDTARVGEEVKAFKVKTRKVGLTAHKPFRPFKKVAVGGNGKQKFYKPAYRHQPEMDLEDLHDGETYCFYEFGMHGSELKVIPGYRLKYNWEGHEKAHYDPFPPKLQMRLPKHRTNWIEVTLPNGKLLSVQPRSATRSYYKNGR
jgi:hypothetical protein